MDDITLHFDRIINESRELDIAEAEFKRHIADDPELRALYRQWCEENDTTERRGFIDYAREYVEQNEEKWDSLTDYDE